MMQCVGKYGLAIGKEVLPVLLLKLLNAVTSLLSYTLFIGSK